MKPPDEARKHPRLKVNQEVWVEVLGDQSRLLPARIVDASQNGVRLRGVDNALPGSAVAIRMEGKLLLGEVVWCSGDDVGIVLEYLVDSALLEKLRRDE